MTADGVLDELLEDTRAFLGNQLVLDPEHLDLAVLWLACAKTMSAWDRLGFLRVQSPLPGSGKTVLLENLGRLIGPKSIHTGNITESAAFRLAATQDRIFLLDECDVLLPAARTNDRTEALRGLFAQCWKRGSKVPRSKAASKKMGDIEVEELPVFALIALAGLRTLPPTIADRSIPIVMRRATEDERRGLVVLRDRDGDAAAAPLRERWDEWATEEVITDLASRRPEVPLGLSGRQADNIEGLLAIAERAGQPWPLRAFQAAAAVYSGPDLVGRASFGALLIEGLATIFEKYGTTDFLATPVILQELQGLDSGPFASRYKGDPATKDVLSMSHKLASDLREFGVTPKVKRQGEGTGRGYFREDFRDAFARYAPDVPVRFGVSVSYETSPIPLAPAKATDEIAEEWARLASGAS